MRSELRPVGLALLSCAIVFSAALIGNLATMPSIPTWYAALQKPVFNPPNWIFGPVWIVLYILLAISLFRILNRTEANAARRQALIAFAAQMVFNPLWSITFFYFHAPRAGLVVVVLLELSVLAMIRTLRPLDRVAAFIQWPYAAWVAFATLLNAAIVVLN